MAGISQITDATNSLLTKVAAIPFNWNEYLSGIAGVNIAEISMLKPNNLFQQLAVWNNQPRRWMTKREFPQGKPAAYVQPVFGRGMKLGSQITMYPDFIWKIHIVDWQIDGFNEAGGLSGTDETIGGLDQNLEILAWRDLVKTNLELFPPLNCGAITTCDEYPDDEHEEIYHYVIEFKCCFTDTKGGQLDPTYVPDYVDPPQPAGQFGLNTTIEI